MTRREPYRFPTVEVGRQVDEAEGELTPSEAVLATFRDAAVMVVATEGPEHRIAAANEVLQGFTNGRQLVGLPLAEALPDASGQGFAALFRRVYETGTSVTNYAWRVQIDLPGGGFTEFYASFSLAPWRDPDGTIRGVVGHAVDVTEEVRRRLAAEAASHDAERRYEHARSLVATLQDSLLPAALPVIPGLQIAGHYLLAEEDTSAGGDWLDVIPRPDGRVALVVGDVVGHGVAASALMAQLRAVLNERLASGAGIGAALDALDRVARRVEKAHAATVVVAEVDPATGEVEYCTAGHQPPLVLDHETRYLPLSGAGPLASGRGFSTASTRLAPDDLLLLYSDGIIERPGRTLPQATVELASVARRSFDGGAFRDDAPAVDRVCGHSIEMLVRETGYSDDITLVAAQRVPPPTALEISTQASLSELKPIRARLGDWLGPLNLDEDTVAAFQQAVSECAANVIDHAYRHQGQAGEDQPLSVTARLEASGDLLIRVVDNGTWRRGRSSEPDDSRGRGLMIVSELIDSVTIERNQPESQAGGTGTGDSVSGRGAGTRVTLRHPLTRPVRIVADAGAPLVPPRRIEDDFGTQLDGATLRVRGAVDAASAPAFAAALLTLANGRQAQVCVDLSGVTLLASAGVQVLVDLHAGLRHQDVTLTLLAAAGTFAQRVLDLTQLPYQAPPPA